MATIRKRGNSYQIRVSCGYDTSGNQVVQTMTWKPADGMNKKQIEKELQKQAILFEDKCMKGQVTANIKFQDFAEQWFEEYAKLNLRNTSYERMKQLTVRVYCHVFNQAQARAGDAIASVLDFKKHDTDKGHPEAV